MVQGSPVAFGRKRLQRHQVLRKCQTEGGGNLTDKNTAGIIFTPKPQGLSSLRQTTVLYSETTVLSAVEER